MITSIPDLLIVGGVALLIFGPKRLPELAKSLGKGIRDFKKAVEGSEEQEADKARKVEQIPPHPVATYSLTEPRRDEAPKIPSESVVNSVPATPEPLPPPATRPTEILTR